MTSILTALAMLAHVLVGCCWHHEHSCSAPLTGIAVTAAAKGDAHACKCPHHSETEEPASPEHDKGPCGEDRCVTAFRDSGPESCSQESLPVMVTEVIPTSGRINLCVVAAPAQQSLIPPLRTHLLLQILLI